MDYENKKNDDEIKRCTPKEGMPHAQKARPKKEREKDAYPNKVCHMATRHVKRKTAREKDSPHPRKIKKRDGSCKGVHPRSAKKKIHTLAHLDQIV